MLNIKSIMKNKIFIKDQDTKYLKHIFSHNYLNKRNNYVFVFLG